MALEIPAGTPGTGPNKSKVWCVSQVVPGKRGHFVTKEESDDDKTKACDDCRRRYCVRGAGIKPNAKRRRGLDPDEVVDMEAKSAYLPPPKVQEQIDNLCTLIQGLNTSERVEGVEKCAKGHEAHPDEFTKNEQTGNPYKICERHRLLNQMNNLKIPGGTLITGG